MFLLNKHEDLSEDELVIKYPCEMVNAVVDVEKQVENIVEGES